MVALRLWTQGVREPSQGDAQAKTSRPVGRLPRAATAIAVLTSRIAKASATRRDDSTRTYCAFIPSMDFSLGTLPHRALYQHFCLAPGVLYFDSSVGLVVLLYSFWAQILLRRTFGHSGPRCPHFDFVLADYGDIARVIVDTLPASVGDALLACVSSSDSFFFILTFSIQAAANLIGMP